jgi:hypothetical protein
MDSPGTDCSNYSTHSIGLRTNSCIDPTGCGKAPVKLTNILGMAELRVHGFPDSSLSPLGIEQHRVGPPMCSPRLSSSLHPRYRNNHKCGLWTGGCIGPTGCGEAPSEAHDISVPWPMELKLRDLRPGVTPYGCPRGGPNSKNLGLALVNRSCRSCFPGRCQQHEISCAGWPARPGGQCDGVGEGLGPQVSCDSPEITQHDIQT